MGVNCSLAPRLSGHGSNSYRVLGGLAEALGRTQYSKGAIQVQPLKLWGSNTGLATPWLCDLG